MPIYEYECDSCHFNFEKKQGFDDEPVSTCPRCQGIAHRVFHSTPVIFKVSGFYTTDNRQGGDIEAEQGKEKPPEKSSDKEKPKEE